MVLTTERKNGFVQICSLQIYRKFWAKTVNATFEYQKTGRVINY